MNLNEKSYSDEDIGLLKKIIVHLNKRDYNIALEMIHKRLLLLKSCKNCNEFFLKIELAGYLIDIGEEGRNRNAVTEGLDIIENERGNITGLITEGSIEYNLGNAKGTLFKIQREEPGFKYVPENMEYLIQAKNHYWKAYKYEFEVQKTFRPELIVNLANSLSSCGRVVESLQYYDIAIQYYSTFPQAHASRSKELLWLAQLSGHFSINLINQAKCGYELASKAENLPDWLTSVWKKEAIKLHESLQKLGYNVEEINNDISDTQKEYETLSKYRQFCINNHITLSEHSLYCNCIGSRRDDLLICSPIHHLGGEDIPIWEKVLNRLKSEFALARLMYYYSLAETDSDFTSFDTEVMFSELYDSEYIGTKSEMLRTSFKLCFGLLDKIASSICNLYDLADENENIYFESFWNPRKQNSPCKRDTRWEIINSNYNISLLALYTQASDLNRKDGEWAFFKSWRNLLEHNHLALISDDAKRKNKEYKCSPMFCEVNKDYFQEKTLQMIQFTRSAIFNFVFLIRNEFLKEKDDKHQNTKTMHIKFRNDDNT